MESRETTREKRLAQASDMIASLPKEKLDLLINVLRTVVSATKEQFAVDRQKAD